MTCYRPLTAYRSSEVNPATGKRGIVWSAHHPKRLVEGSSIFVPCGRCIGCRIDRSRDWAVRCSHEAKLHEFNSFLTLTYDPKKYPDDYSVDVEVHKKFVKRLRERTGVQLRYFMCGEYGSEEGKHPYQPHYHYLIFGYRPRDLRLHKRERGNDLWTSEEVAKAWKFGFCTVGNVSYGTAAYVARYITKKQTGDYAPEHYTRVHPLTGKLVRVRPEFALGSRRPPVGHGWFSKFKSDVYPSDFCVVEGKKHPVPKYYIRLLEEEERRKTKIKRRLESLKHRSDATPARLRVREVVKTAQVNLLKRGLE